MYLESWVSIDRGFSPLPDIADDIENSLCGLIVNDVSRKPVNWARGGEVLQVNIARRRLPVNLIGFDVSSQGAPFWLENPGREHLAKGVWTERLIDPDLTGVHCIARADIDNDGREDLIINNFVPDRGLGDSMVWYSIPKQPR